MVDGRYKFRINKSSKGKGRVQKKLVENSTKRGGEMKKHFDSDHEFGQLIKIVID